MIQVIEAQAPASTMPRPRMYDDAIVRVAAAKLAEECAEWQGEGDAEDWIDDLVKCRHSWDDGYQLAKALDDRCSLMGADFALVEILDNAHWRLSEAHDDALKKWVQLVGFTPAFTIGDKVKWPHGEGFINEIKAETAQYLISDGSPQFANGGGYVVEAERVEAA